MASEHELTLQTDRMQANIEDGIGWMVFNNPARHNALSLEMWEGIGDILEHFARTTMCASLSCVARAVSPSYPVPIFRNSINHEQMRNSAQATG